MKSILAMLVKLNAKFAKCGLNICKIPFLETSVTRILLRPLFFKTTYHLFLENDISPLTDDIVLDEVFDRIVCPHVVTGGQLTRLWHLKQRRLGVNALASKPIFFEPLF